MQVAINEEGGDHSGHSHEGHQAGCSHSASLRYYMPKDRMSTVDKIINEILFERKDFFTCDNY